MNDLEGRIFLAIASNLPTKQPAAVLEEIERTHVLVERERWERIKTNNDRLDSAIRNTHVIVKRDRWERVAYAARLAAHYQLAAINPGDGDDIRGLDPIRHDAAESDTPETA